eukprot:ctg_561.g202
MWSRHVEPVSSTSGDRSRGPERTPGARASCPQIPTSGSRRRKKEDSGRDETPPVRNRWLKNVGASNKSRGGTGVDVDVRTQEIRPARDSHDRLAIVRDNTWTIERKTRTLHPASVAVDNERGVAASETRVQPSVAKSSSQKYFANADSEFYSLPM